MNSFVAKATGLSRRGADEAIFEGRVSIDGKRVDHPGIKVTGEEKILFDGKRLSVDDEKIWIAMNKPPGYITTRRDAHGRRTVMELLPEKYRKLFPVGRLDTNTTGTLLFTNDGEIANALLHPRFEMVREYEVVIRGHLTDDEIALAKKGVLIDGRVARPKNIRIVKKEKDREVVLLEFREGRYHEVRRFFLALSHKVISLDRISFAGISAKDIPQGKWRLLRVEEISRLSNIFHTVKKDGKRE